jgi:hypothetical protein
MASSKMIAYFVKLLLGVTLLLTKRVCGSDALFTFWIDLKTKGIKNEGTTNNVVIRFLDEDGEELHKKVKNGLTAGKRMIKYEQWGGRYEIDSVEVHVEGTDAMMIDRAWLKEWHGNIFGSEKIDEWGRNNDKKGWCISEDPGDINGSWSGSASECSPGVSFKVGGGANYLQKHNYFRNYKYCLDLNVDGVSHKDSKSDSPIRFEVFSKGDRMIYENTYHSGWYNNCMGFLGPWCCFNFDAADHFHGSGNPSDWDGDTSFKLIIEGNDAFLIDRVKKETLESNEVQYWGANNNYGWCLSTDPNGINGSFNGHAESCHECIQWNDNGDVKIC